MGAKKDNKSSMKPSGFPSKPAPKPKPDPRIGKTQDKDNRPPKP